VGTGIKYVGKERDTAADFVVVSTLLKVKWICEQLRNQNGGMRAGNRLIYQGTV
jgi:hypothetical protein